MGNFLPAYRWPLLTRDRSPRAWTCLQGHRALIVQQRASDFANSARQTLVAAQRRSDPCIRMSKQESPQHNEQIRRPLGRSEFQKQTDIGDNPIAHNRRAVRKEKQVTRVK